MPFISEDYFCQQVDPDSGRLTSKPREMFWLITNAQQRTAAQVDLPKVDETDRLILLAQLVYAIGRLHKHGWIFGDLSFKNVVFALDPPRMMLIGCDGAAPISDADRRQYSTPLWDPPENSTGYSADRQDLQDAVTDVYKLGLAILRCLTPGKGAMTTRSVHRFAGELDADGIDLVDRALSADRGRRPTAKEIYHYLYRVVSERTALPEVISARLVTPYRLRGQDVRIEWQIEKASNITISVGDSFELQVDTVTHRDGCLFRPDESGLVSIEVHNRFGSISMDLGEVTFDELPPFTVSLNDIPRPQVPAIEAFTLEPMIAALAGAPRVGVSFPVMPSLRTLDLLENLMPDIPSMVISTNRILTK